VSKRLRLTLALLLLCAPLGWWALRTASDEPSPAARPEVPRSLSQTARAPQASHPVPVGPVVDGPSQEPEPEHPLHGLVIDEETLQPIEGASVRFVTREHRWLERLTSDAQGAFQVNLPQGSYSFEAVARDYVVKGEHHLRVPRQEPLRILLVRHSVLEGQVIDGATEAPVADAEVLLHQDGYAFNGESPERTDAQGRFTLSIGEGTYHLTAKAGARAGAYPGALKIERGSQRDGLVIRLGSTGSLAGSVFGLPDRQPLERASVTILHVDSGWSSSVEPEVDGRFRLEHLPPGEYELSAQAAGFATAKRVGLQLKAQQELTVDMALVRAASLEGTVTDALGQPADEAIISARLLGESPASEDPPSGMSDSQGQYTIDMLSPGRYQLQAQSVHGGAPVLRELTLAAGEKARADFTLSNANGRLEGIVRQGNGAPALHGVTVTVTSNLETGLSATITTTGDASFSLMLEPGLYVVTAEDSEVGEAGPEQRVTVEAGKTAQVVLTVPDPDAGVETSGIVLTSRGAPAPKAYVTLSNDDDDDLSNTDVTDERGHFMLKTPGKSAGARVTLAASLGAEYMKVEDVRVGSKDLVLRMRQAASLRGRVSARAGAPVNGFVLSVNRQEDSEPLFAARSFVGETFTLHALPADALEVLVRTTDGRSGKANVRLEPGGTQQLELLVGGLGRVQGRLVTTSGAPDTGWVYLNSQPPGAGERTANVDETGRFELFALEPGTHVLELSHSSQPEEELRTLSVTLRPGETLDLGDLGPAPPTPERGP